MTDARELGLPEYLQRDLDAFKEGVRTGEIGLAPVFDCGSCLLPQADERVMRAMLENDAELESRIYTFPNSML